MVIDFKKLFKEVLIEVLNELGYDMLKAAGGGQGGAPAAPPATYITAPAPPTPAEKPAPPAEKPAPSLAPAPAVTREQVGTALVKLATEKGRDAAVAVLASLGAQKLDDVAAANYGKLLEAITTAALV